MKAKAGLRATFLPECIDDYIGEDNPVRVIEAFVDELDLQDLGFQGVMPEETGRPSYHPSTLLKIYIYGYLNRIQSSRRLERETQRNVELMWLTGRLTPDFKTIADFRKDNGGVAIRGVCREFILLCRRLELFSQAMVAIDGSKFKAVNNRDRNFTSAKMKRRLEQIEESINRYLGQLDTADRQESQGAQIKAVRLKEKVAKLKDEMRRLKKLELAEEKTRGMLFGRFAAATRLRYRQGRPDTFEFLGFKHVCGVDRSGRFALIRIPSTKSCRKFLARTREWIMHRRHWRRWEQQERLTRMLGGFYQYFG